MVLERGTVYGRGNWRGGRMVIYLLCMFIMFKIVCIRNSMQAGPWA